MNELSLEECLELAKSKLKDIKSIINAQNSLHEFTRQAWPVIRGEDFIDGWHIGAIAEHIEALHRREIHRLLINVPPRTTKSTLISVMTPAWIWLQTPDEKFIYASHSRDLSYEHSILCRRLIQSEWYNARWGKVFKIISDQNTKGKFENDMSGFRLSTSVGSGITGIGGSFLTGDDLNDHKSLESKVTRDKTNEWYGSGFSTRLNDPKTSVMLNVQQRYHQEDSSGTIIDHDENGEYTKLVLPMRYEPIRRCFTIPLKSTKGIIWSDPREKDGELLWPERFGEKELKKLESALGSEYNIAGQLQQRPAPSEGGLIKKDWFKWWKQDHNPKFQQVIQSWDTAFTDSKKGDYSACTTWGIFNDDNRVPNLMLIGMWRGQVLYPDLRRISQKLAKDYRYDGKNDDLPTNHSFKPDLIIVESKASGQSLIPDLQQAGIMCVGFNPTKYGDKNGRVQMVSHIIECGRVWVPAMNPTYKQLKPFADKFVEECAVFPNGSSRDLVDSMTQVLIRVKQGGFIQNPSDPDDENYNEKPKFIY